MLRLIWCSACFAKADKLSREVEVVTSLIQPDAMLLTALAKPASSATGSGASQASFTTTLQSAASNNSPVTTISAARNETQLRPSDEEKDWPNLQQSFAPVVVPPVLTPPVAAATHENPHSPFSTLPGKVGKENVTQPAGSEPATANDSRNQPPFPPAIPVQLPPATEAPPSTTTLRSTASGQTNSTAGAPQAFTNPADPPMRVPQTAASAPPIPVAAAATLSSSEGQPPALPVSKPAADPTAASSNQPSFTGGPIASPASDLPAPDLSALTAAPTSVAFGSQVYPAEMTPEQAANFMLSSTAETATTAPTSQPNASAAAKPPRTPDTEPRPIGSVPLRETIANSAVFPQVSKVLAAPANLKTGAATFSSPALGSAGAFEGSHLSQSPDSSAASTVNRAVKEKPPAIDSPDPLAPAANPPDSSPLPRQIDAQLDNLSTANPVSVITSASGQNPVATAPATIPGESQTPHPTQTSADPAAIADSAQTARVVQGVAQSEMHIGFRSPAFGSVEVHTAVRDTQLGLSVSSERGDLRGLLAQEVPALQAVFHQQGLQFDQIRFVSPGNGTGTGFSSGSNSNSPGNGHNPRSWFSKNAVPEPNNATSEIQISTTRLSVHA
jgi:hypothetical protein